MSIDFQPDRDLYPFESRWFESSQGWVHYVDEGSGPPILFCHGNPTWSFLYRNVITGLRSQFRCIAPDYLGFGLSDRPNEYGYTVEEHARIVGELADFLGLDGYVSMGQDWGGPVSLAVATARAERVRAIVLGNTWFWPADSLSMKVFSTVMSSRPMQSAIRNRNFFIERLMPLGTARTLTPLELEHYRAVQPSPMARRGVAELPKQILAARPLLQRLEHDVPAMLGAKPALFVWGMKDPAFKPAQTLPRMKAAFPDHVVVELPDASHFIQEDAPEQISAAIISRFG